jgi:hypothetical protein
MSNLTINFGVKNWYLPVQNSPKIARFEVFTTVRMMMVFWVLARYRLVGRCQRLGETCWLHLYGWRRRRMFLLNPEEHHKKLFSTKNVTLQMAIKNFSEETVFFSIFSTHVYGHSMQDLEALFLLWCNTGGNLCFFTKFFMHTWFQIRKMFIPSVR